MDNTLQRIKQTNDLKADKALEARRHFEAQDASRAMQETTLKAFKSLVAYLDNPRRVTKTNIVNQLSEIATPDALKVADAVKDLHETIKTHKNTDLSEIAMLLKGVLEQTKQIPKEHEDITIPSPVDNTKQLNSLEAAVKAVEQTIKGQKLVAEAPIVNLPEPKITVEKPDLSPLQEEQKKTRQELVKAVKAIIIPKTDLATTEKELKKLNKLFNEFLDSVPSGGGGGGGVVSYVATDGNARPVELQSDGSVPVTVISGGGGGGGSTLSKPTDAYSIQAKTDDGTYTYFFFEDASANWYILRKTQATNIYNYTKGTGGYASVYVDATHGPSGSPTFASYGVTF